MEAKTRALYKDCDGLAIYEVAQTSSGFVAVGDSQPLPLINWRDTPKRRSDGSLPGCDNQIWLISDSEAILYVATSQERVQERELENTAAVKTADDKVRVIYDAARATGKRQALRSHISERCLDRLPECSFDAVTIWAMPDGTKARTYTHCY